jgi:hypothetical protein
VERLLGDGSLGRVYEATQLSLGRTVALRLMEPGLFADAGFTARFHEQQRLAASVHHPHIVPTYEAADWEEGKLVATRYVRGRSLAALIEDGTLSPGGARALLEPVLDAVRVAHEAGLVHGRLAPRNVLIDAGGAPHLTDLGLGRPGTAEDDRRAIAALVADTQRAVRHNRRRVRAAAAVAAIAVLATGAVLLSGGSDGPDADARQAPPVTAGTVSIGSDLGPGAVDSVGCSDDPGPNTPACTLSQLALGGRSMTVARAGVIRRWAVRGATGDLALHVIVNREGRSFQRGFSRVERVPDRGPHAFETSIGVERGDRIGVLLAPGAAIGTRTASGGAPTLRWEGALDFSPQPQPQTATRLDRELLLRADVAVGGRIDLPQRTGRRAATAEPGRSLAQAWIDLARRAVRVELVRVGDAIALDAFRGRARIARLHVPDADPRGRVLSFDGTCGYVRGLCLRWLGEGEPTPVVHAYRLAKDGSFRVIG